MTKPDLTVQLGDFVFSGAEVPEGISIGGTQMLAVHQLIGGTRIIDALGPVPDPLSFSGWLVGEKAQDRVLYLDQLRASGLELPFSFGQLSYRVVISKFNAVFQRRYQFTYSITLEVVDTDHLLDGISAYPSINDLIDQDLNTADALGDKVGDSGVTGFLASIRAATKSISDFAKATSQQISAVLQPVAECRSAINDLLGTANNTIQNVTTIGGILPNNPVAQNANKMLEQVNAMNSTPDLYQLDSVLGRIQTNVGNANSGSKTTTMAGGNLYDVAAKSYGDAMAWTTIAKANNLKDPEISGIQTLTIPPKSDGSRGLLNA